MSVTKVLAISFFQPIRRLLLAACAVIFLVITGAVILYRTEILRWSNGLPAREWELVWLIFGAVLLIAIFLAISWDLVQSQRDAKLMRSNLAMNEARLKSLFQTIPDMIWMKDGQGVYLACNSAFERFFGAKEHEIVGKTDYDFVDRELADFFRVKDKAALEAAEPQSNEEWVTLADSGKRVLLETIKLPIRTGSDGRIGVLGVARDITRRYEAEKEALFFRDLVEFSGDPIYVMDRLQCRMVFVNQAACDHFEASREEIANWTIFDWDPVITRESIEANMALLERGGNVHFETMHRTATGKIVPVEISVNRIFSPDGRKLSAGHIRNISGRKMAEMALRQSHQQLLDLTANVPGVVFQYRQHRDGRVSFPFVGSTAAGLYGIAPEAIYANPQLPFDLLHPDDMEKLELSIRWSARTMRPWQCEFRIILPNEDIRWVLGNSRPASGDDGGIVWHGFITDITELKKIEASLQDHQERLRQLVAHQDRIREDERKRIAREIHDELGQYLLAMRIDVSMLARLRMDAGATEGAIDRILEQIDGTMKKVRAIINNIRPSVLDLGLFAALEWQLKEFERRSGIAYQLVGVEENVRVGEGTATTLFRVMQEALTNVQRHAKATHVKVDLRLEGSHLVMTVADNGIGIAEGKRAGGDRFGLIGIRERIAMLGGEVAVENRNGTVLNISLPVEKTSGRPVLHS